MQKHQLETHLRLCLSFAIALGVSACDIDEDFDEDIVIDENGDVWVPDDDLEVGYDSYYLADADAASMYALADPVNDSVYDGLYLTNADGTVAGNDPERVATAVAGAVDSYFAPAGCAQAARTEAEVTLTLTDCSGPIGMSTAAGTILVAFSTTEDDDLAIDVSSENLVIDGFDAVLDVSGVYSVGEDGEKRVDVNSQSQIVRDGETIRQSLTGEITWTPASQCVTVNGTGQLIGESATYTLDVSDYTRCARACPSQGIIALSNGDDLTVTFDGTSNASYVKSSGTTGEIALACVPEQS
jgi:hypothetical protein